MGRERGGGGGGNVLGGHLAVDVSVGHGEGEDNQTVDQGARLRQLEQRLQRGGAQDLEVLGVVSAALHRHKCE